MINEKSDVKIKPQAHKLSLNEKIALCKTWELSGMSKSRFCKKHNLTPSSFYKWCERLSPKRQKTPTFKVPISEFMPVHAIPTANVVEVDSDLHKTNLVNELSQDSKTTSNSVVSNITLEIKLPNTTTIHATLPLSQASALLKEMIHANSTLR